VRNFLITTVLGAVSVTAAFAQVVYPPLTNAIVPIYGNNQTTPPLQQFVRPLTVQVVSPAGLPVAGATVTFTLPTPGIPSAQFPAPFGSTASVVTNSLGFATSPYLTSLFTLGAFSAVVTSTGLPSAKFNLTTAIAPPNPGPPSVAPNYLAFSMSLGAAPPSAQTLTIVTPANTFTATADSPWIKMNPRGSNFLDVSVDPTGLPVGVYDGLVIFNGGQSTSRVMFKILALPAIYSSVKSLTFTYTQGAQVLPLIQPFSVGSSMNNFNFDVAEVYNSPSTGNWLGVASKRGMSTPIQLLAMVDPRGLVAGTYTGAIQLIAATSNSPVSIPVTLVVTYVAPRLTPHIVSFANAATSLDGSIAAGELVNLGGDTLSCASAPVVTVDGDAAQIVSATDSRIQLVVPNSVIGKDRVPVQVGCGDAHSDAFSVPVDYAAPAVFAASDTQAMALNEDLSANTPANPASRGSVVTIYGTGFGALDSPDPNTGAVRFLAPLGVAVAGEPAEVLSAADVANQPGVVAVRIRVPWNINVSDPVAIDVQSGTLHAPALTIGVQ
jgi:uncharacterized protein (TIGR03437 family)